MGSISLPGAERYPLPVGDRERKREEEIERANRDIPIQDVLQDLFGVHIPAELDRSWKDHCPFGFEHPDGGIERAMRVYQSNTAYCFATHGFLSPVRLGMLRWDCSPLIAARRLLQQHHLTLEKESYRQRMQRLILEDEQKETTSSAQTAVSALQMFLSKDNRYTSRQFDPDVTQFMEGLLQELDDAINKKRTGAVRDWFAHAQLEAKRFLDAT